MSATEYFDSSGAPSTGSQASSAVIRAEFDLVQAGFGKLPDLSGNGSKAVVVNSGGSGLETTTGTLALAGNFATAGSSAVTLTSTGATNVTLPTTGTLASLAGTETLTGKTVNLASNTLTGTTAQFNAALSDGSFATLAGNESFSNKSFSDNLTFTGTGNRITGDFSNATVANRVMFQSSTTNGATDVLAAPNGTSQRAGFLAYNNSDIASATSNTQLLQLSTETRLMAGGSSPLPMTFLVGNAERLRINTSGEFGIGGANYGTAGQVITSGGVGAAPSWSDAFKDVAANAQSGSYTLALTDRGGSVDSTAGVTIPPNSTVAFPVGSVVAGCNTSASAVTITQGAGVTLRQAGTANIGNRTLAGYGMWTARKTATDTWFISGAGLS